MSQLNFGRPKPPLEPFHIKAVEWETNNGSGTTIAIGAAVPFDTVQFDNTNNEITFDTTTKQFTIKGRSVWKVSWNILASAAAGTGINLVANAATILTTPLAGTLAAGPIHGEAIVILPNRENLVSLVVTGAALTLNDAPPAEAATITFLRLA